MCEVGVSLRRHQQKLKSHIYDSCHVLFIPRSVERNSQNQEDLKYSLSAEANNFKIALEYLQIT